MKLIKKIFDNIVMGLRMVVMALFVLPGWLLGSIRVGFMYGVELSEKIYIPERYLMCRSREHESTAPGIVIPAADKERIREETRKLFTEHSALSGALVDRMARNVMKKRWGGVKKESKSKPTTTKGDK